MIKTSTEGLSPNPSDRCCLGCIVHLYFVFGAGCCADEAQSQAAFAIRAMTLSRVVSSAEESETKTATASCVPLGSVMIPISLVAEVMPLRVPPVPVLCATTVP